MAYEFTDTSGPNIETPDPLRTIWGGSVLDEVIPGFRTLNVTGRELMSPQLSMTARVGGDGVWVDHARLPERYIYVEALVLNYNEAARLNAKLHKGLQELAFTDAPGWLFQAFYHGYKAPKNDRRQQVITLTFVCPDPYARSAAQVSTGTLAGEPGYPVALESIVAVPEAAGASLRITCGQHNLYITGPIAAGAVYKVSWLGSPILTENGQPAANRLELASDYEGFSVKAGDTITSTPAAALTITYRERRL